MRFPTGDDGFAGGFEVLPFGVLVFVVGTLILLNAWAVVDGRMAVTAAAREASRAYVESPPSSADADSLAAAQDAMRSYGRSAGGLRLSHDAVPLQRCERVTFTASFEQRTISLPLIGGIGPSHSVQARHSEIIDRFAARDGLDARSACGR